MMRIVLEELKRLIDEIESAYTETTTKWTEAGPERINLKRSLVSDIETNSTLYKYIMEYVQLLNKQVVGITLQFQFMLFCCCRVTARVKTQNSIAYKIQSYKTAKHEQGKIPINKCINDLFGVRVILDIPLTFDEIQAFLNQYYPKQYRCIDSSKGTYKAVHLYFRADNCSFPWELQIWNRCDMETNYASHKKYKQEYTTWEKESKEGGIING